MNKILIGLGFSTTITAGTFLGTFVVPSAAEAAIIGGSSVNVVGSFSFDSNDDGSSAINFEEGIALNRTNSLEDVERFALVTVSHLIVNDDNSINPQADFLNFGEQTIAGETGNLTIDLLGGSFRGDNLLEERADFQAQFNFNNQTIAARGDFSFSTTGSQGYTISTQAVPEPTTILGLALAGGLGAFGVKKKKESHNQD